MEMWVVVACFVLGLLLGSFANVVIHRVPDGESVVRPPSACPSCGSEISPRDNIPVLSWLLLRGRCRHCGEPISIRYPAVELTMGVVFAAFGARFGLSWELPGFLLFAWMLVVVSVIDARTRRIPNKLTYPLTPALLVLMVLAALLVLALISPRGMGMGDVKLAAFIGIGLGYLGWGNVVVGIFGAFLLGGVVAIVLVLTRLRRRKDHIPFGPYLAVAALAAALFGDALVEGYLRASGLG
jgi:leader peptidase (prepilin peptidase) / N-methyltransferase